MAVYQSDNVRGAVRGLKEELDATSSRYKSLESDDDFLKLAESLVQNPKVFAPFFNEQNDLDEIVPPYQQVIDNPDDSDNEIEHIVNQAPIQPVSSAIDTHAIQITNLLQLVSYHLEAGNRTECTKYLNLLTTAFSNKDIDLKTRCNALKCFMPLLAEVWSEEKRKVFINAFMDQLIGQIEIEKNNTVDKEISDAQRLAAKHNLLVFGNTARMLLPYHQKLNASKNKRVPDEASEPLLNNTAEILTVLSVGYEHCLAEKPHDAALLIAYRKLIPYAKYGSPQFKETLIGTLEGYLSPDPANTKTKKLSLVLI